MKKLLLTLALLLLPCVSEATVTAASCENKVGQQDVQTAIDFAGVGEKVIIPAGTCTWTISPKFPENHHIELTGSGEMPLVGSATSGGTTIKWQADAVGGDIVSVNVGTNGGWYLELKEVTTGNQILSNIKFLYESELNKVQFGMLMAPGCCPGGNTAQFPFTGYKPAIVHHVSWESTVTPTTIHAFSVQTVRALFYRNHIKGALPGPFSGNTGPTIHCVGAANTEWKSWFAASTFGTNDTKVLTPPYDGQNLYAENNKWENIGGTFDLDSGCRAVIRNNEFIDSAIADHGNDSSFWGHRHTEFYDNTFRCVNPWNLQGTILARGGTWAATDNIIPSCLNGEGVPRPRFGATIQPLNLMYYYMGGSFVAPQGCFPGPYPWYRQFGWGYLGPDLPNLSDDGDRAYYRNLQQLEPAYIWNNKNTEGGTPGEADTFFHSTTQGTCQWPAGSGVAPTGNVTNGSNVITGVSSTVGVCGSDTCNMRIQGTGIPANTTIVSTTANTITMSQNANATNTGVTLTVDNNNQTVAGYIQQNREYYLSVAKPGYTKAPYPHPLATVIGGGSAEFTKNLGGGAFIGGGGTIK